MQVTTGNISELIDWFHADRWFFGKNYWDPARENLNYCNFKLLCLLVAGDLKDHDLFNDIFDNRAAIDTITGHDIAIFLFAPKLVEAFKVDVDGGKRILIPGKSLPSDETIFKTNIENISREHKAEIIDRSKFVSREICEYFKIPVDEIPAIVVLRKAERSPIIIPTMGETEIRSFFQFLRDLRNLADDLPDINEVRMRFQERKRVFELEKQIQYRQSELVALSNALGAKQTDRDSYYSKLLAMVLEQCKLTKDSAAKLLECEDIKNLRAVLRGVIPDPQLPKESKDLFQKASMDVEFRKNCHGYTKSHRAVSSIAIQIASAEREIRDLESKIGSDEISINASFLVMLQEVNAMELTYQSVATRIEELSSRYENALKRRAKFRPIKECVLNFLDYSKRSKELLSLRESIVKILKE